MAYALLLVSVVLLVAGAVVLTNAIEWAGHRLELGEGAVGSVLAAVATALPESIIPLVALIGGGNETGVAIGAIVGAPFMLGTIAMALVGLSVAAFHGSRPQGRLLDLDAHVVARDLLVFLVCFGGGVLLGLGTPAWLRYAAAAAFVVAYAAYVRRTLRDPGELQEASELAPLIFARRAATPHGGLVAAQLVLALAAIVLASELFVHQLVDIADGLGVAPLVLSLVLAPLATELPEKLNSVIWVRAGKDGLALGNITGAMVFQSTLPVALGLAFSGWALGTASLLAAGLALAGGALALVLLARGRRFAPPAIASWAALYGVFVLYVAVWA